MYNPYEKFSKGGLLELKGNFHIHADGMGGTCSKYPLREVFEAYHEANYKVLAITNHNRETAIDYDAAKEFDITVIEGFEYTKATEHMCCIGSGKVILDEHQRAIDAFLEEGGFSFLCHPHFKYMDYWTVERMMALRDYIGIEIYNGVVMDSGEYGLSTDSFDSLLSKGKKIWGFANDDLHRWKDIDRCFNLILSKENTKEEIIKAIKEGSFYCSTGLYLDELTFENGKISVKAAYRKKPMLDYIYRFIGFEGEVLAEIKGTKGEYALNGNEKYVRIEAVSPYGAMLWTQPIFFER